MLCLDVDSPSLHAFYVDLQSAHLGCGATDPRSEGEPGMSYLISRAADRQWADSASGPQGSGRPCWSDGRTGRATWRSGCANCAPGAAIPAHRLPFEESWYIFSGQGRRSVAGLRYDVTRCSGDYGVSPGRGGGQVEATGEDLSWLCIPGPRSRLPFEGAAATLPAAEIGGEDLGRPSETDPRHRYRGSFSRIPEYRPARPAVHARGITAPKSPISPSA